MLWRDRRPIPTPFTKQQCLYRALRTSTVLELAEVWGVDAPELLLAQLNDLAKRYAIICERQFGIEPAAITQVAHALAEYFVTEPHFAQYCQLKPSKDARPADAQLVLGRTEVADRLDAIAKAHRWCEPGKQIIGLVAYILEFMCRWYR